MTKIIHELPVVFACFAYRPEYVAELDGMLPTIRKHHPDWPIVAGRGPIGRGPIDGYDLPTLDVESPEGKLHWSLPVPLNLDGTVDDWRKICRMKAWWIGEVWHNFGRLAGPWQRVLWIDADARLLGPLDIELEPEAELIAGPFLVNVKDPDDDMLGGGFLFFQGAEGGRVEGIIDEWSSLCVSQIENMPPSNPRRPWPDSDQEMLKRVLRDYTDTEGYTLLKLEQDKYNAIPDKDGTPLAGALVDQWVLGCKMRFPKDRDKQWPPPEEARRPAPAPAASEAD